MENINNLIAYLVAIANFAKDIHYSCYGEAFYGKHLFVDLIQDDLYNYIDLLKEVCLLGNEIAPLPSSEYMRTAIELIPMRLENDDYKNFENMKSLIVDTLALMENTQNLTRGENNLLDDISQNLQQKVGLINQQIKV